MARILLIDDDAEVRGVLKAILESAGHETLEAENGKIGVQRAVEHHPDLVLTDILMPEKDGLEAIEEIRRRHPALRVIAMSGGGRYPGFEFLEVAKWLGADALLTKPVRAAQLLEAVSRVLTQPKPSGPPV